MKVLTASRKNAPRTYDFYHLLRCHHEIIFLIEHVSLACMSLYLLECMHIIVVISLCLVTDELGVEYPEVEEDDRESGALV